MLLALGVTLGYSAVPVQNDVSAPPNVVLIISDDQAWTDYGFMGHPTLRTPHLDRLAREGLVYPRGYVPASLCCPSLVSIITGLYPHQHRITSNDPPLPNGKQGAAAQRDREFHAGRERLMSPIDQLPTLPRLLAEKGYVSFQSGKWWQGHHRRGGFTAGMTHGDMDAGGRHGDVGLTIGRETMEPIYGFVRQAVNEGHPFFVWYAPFLPHQPHNPPDRLLEHYRDVAPTLAVARYFAMVEWLDETCGQLLEFLAREGLAADTVVVYVADNGWIQDPQADRFAPRSKQSPYDGGLRTPIILRGPGIAPAESMQPVSSIDLAPTILNLAGLRPTADMQGINLLDPAAVANRNAVYGACYTHNAVDIEDPASSLRWRWMIRDPWKLILPAPQNEPVGEPELYDILTDPYEQENRADQEPARVQELTRALDRWWVGR